MSLRSSFVGVRNLTWRPMRPGRVSAGSRFVERDVRRADEVDLVAGRPGARAAAARRVPVLRELAPDACMPRQTQQDVDDGEEPTSRMIGRRSARA